MHSSEKFYNINEIVNANAIRTTDGKGWVVWSLDRLKDGLSRRRLNVIAGMLTK